MPNEYLVDKEKKSGKLKNLILTLAVAFATFYGGIVKAHSQEFNGPAAKPDKTPKPTLFVTPTDTVVPPTDTVVPPTDTVVPPTDTVVPSRTPRSTRTPRITTTPTSTDTAVPPTDTVVPPTDTVVPPTDTVVPPKDTVIPPTITVDTKATQQAKKTAEAGTRVAEKTAEAGTRVAEKTASAVRTSTGTPTSSPENTATATATQTNTATTTRTNTATVSPTIKNPDIFNPPATMTGTSTVTPSVTPSITSIADFISPSPITEPQPIVAGPSSYEQIYGQIKTPEPEQASTLSRPKYTKDWNELSKEEQEFLINTNLYREYILKVRKEREERARAKQNNFIKINPIDLAKRRAETQIESQILDSAQWKELISNPKEEARRRFNIWLNYYLDEVLKNKPNKPLVTPESN